MNKKAIIITTLLAILIVVFLLNRKQTTAPVPYQFNEGPIFGTTYHIKYQYAKDVKREIDSTLQIFNNSLSSYKPNSIISRINNNDPYVVPDKFFLTAYKEAMVVAEATDGAYDPTVAPLVNLWGFGFKKNQVVTQLKIDSLKRLIGYKKVRLANNRIEKDDPRITLDLASLSDGYASDVIAALLEQKGVSNYMVEIGGEVMLKGVNAEGKAWSIGIDKPIDNQAPTTIDLEAKVQMTRGAISTSGNYRNFYYKDGKKYAHTIDPKTGYPVQHNLLSATIVAPTCIEADAYSTACMVIGLEESLELIRKHPQLIGYFIYADKNGNMQVKYTKRFEKLLSTH
ncbi:MAG: FAD:protein FMN transferase [Bacteroidota bacterium]|nr:FAD:protein FMN transferase [Bacteroidota bacterium]